MRSSIPHVPKSRETAHQETNPTTGRAIERNDGLLNTPATFF